MKKLPKKLSLHRETLHYLTESSPLKDAAGGVCSKLGTSCGSCVRACSFTCTIACC
jgi:hypothetical protein